MQTKGVRGQKIPKNANVICERPLTVKSTMEISQNFVAFSEYMNFNNGNDCSIEF